MSFQLYSIVYTIVSIEYQLIVSRCAKLTQGDLTCFILSGIAGDWKNLFTEAQEQRFNAVYKDKMNDVTFKFMWDWTNNILAFNKHINPVITDRSITVYLTRSLCDIYIIYITSLLCISLFLITK